MDIFSFSQNALRMDARAWARHGNPWSVYSRIVGGTFVFLALWSAFRLGWASLFPIGLAIAWVYLNPRLFEPPLHADAWATRGVLGERAFLNRSVVPISSEHERIANVTTGIAICFLVLAIYGFWTREFWTAFAAWHGATVAKLWFCDRMVVLWDEVSDRTEQYRRWARAEWVE